MYATLFIISGMIGGLIHTLGYYFPEKIVDKIFNVVILLFIFATFLILISRRVKWNCRYSQSAYEYKYEETDVSINHTID